jgi:hypothetical protein
MKAIVCAAYGPPDVFQLRKVERTAPRDKEVLAGDQHFNHASVTFQLAGSRGQWIQVACRGRSPAVVQRGSWVYKKS